jgi:transposase
MLQITLTPEKREAVQALRRDPSLRPAERDRVEMLLLSEAGWPAARIAEHLGYSTATVRRFFHAFQQAGPAAIRRQRPGPAPDARRREQITSALTALLRQPRTWSAPQLAAALDQQSIHLSERQTYRYLHLLAAHWRRTARTVGHKQDPAAVAAATERWEARKKVPRLAS